MDVNEDFVDIARGFIDNGVEFLVVGAYALAAHGFPRTTGDIDLFVRPSPENAGRVFRALAELGAPVAAHGVSQHDFEVLITGSSLGRRRRSGSGHPGSGRRRTSAKTAGRA